MTTFLSSSALHPRFSDWNLVVCSLYNFLVSFSSLWERAGGQRKSWSTLIDHKMEGTGPMWDQLFQEWCCCCWWWFTTVLAMGLPGSESQLCQCWLYLTICCGSTHICLQSHYKTSLYGEAISSDKCLITEKRANSSHGVGTWLVRMWYSTSLKFMVKTFFFFLQEQTNALWHHVLQSIHILFQQADIAL